MAVISPRYSYGNSLVTGNAVDVGENAILLPIWATPQVGDQWSWNGVDWNNIHANFTTSIEHHISRMGVTFPPVAFRRRKPGCASFSTPVEARVVHHSQTRYKRVKKARTL